VSGVVSHRAQIPHVSLYRPEEEFVQTFRRKVIMAALTESTAVDSSSSDVNHKEAYSDSVTSPVAVKSSPSKSEPDANEENSCVTRKLEVEEGSAQAEADDSKKKFIEAPIPKINPWTVKRQAPPAGTQRGNAPKNPQMGELSFFISLATFANPCSAMMKQTQVVICTCGLAHHFNSSVGSIINVQCVGYMQGDHFNSRGHSNSSSNNNSQQL